MTPRRHLSALALLALPLLGGCYVYSTPLADKPVPGTALAAVLNDRGRVDLEPQLGPEVWQVEGTVVSADDSSILLSMTKTSTLEHQEMHWGGETVRFATNDVRSMLARRFSAVRTVILAGTATAGVVAFIASRSLLGLGSGNSGPVSSGGGTGSQ